MGQRSNQLMLSEFVARIQVQHNWAEIKITLSTLAKTRHDRFVVGDGNRSIYWEKVN